jgi:hypothetical protein
MNILIEDKFDELINEEKEKRDAKKYIECLGACYKILKYISNYKEEEIFNKVSKILFYKNQSNYVRIGIIFYFLNNNYINFNDNKNIKRKYYQLLIDSFQKDSINDKIKEKENIIKYFEESELKNFKNLDCYIMTLDSIFIKEKSNSSDRDLYVSSEKEQDIKFNGKSINENNNDLEEDLIKDDSHQNQITQIGLVDKLNSKNFDLDNSIINDTKINTNERYLQKKYKPNNKLPMVLISVSVNLNSNDFMNLINTTFMKLYYRNICTIKSNLHDNINIYEYNPSNFIEKIVYCLANKRTAIKNIFQVIVILKKDDNNFTSGLNYYLNDNYERKISIKTIRGSEKNVIKFMIKFLKLFSTSVNKIKIIKQTKSFAKYNLEELLNSEIKNKKDNLLKTINLPKKNQFIPDEETLVEKSNKKANQYYDIYKTLSNTEYDLGKSIFNFIENFKNKCKELTSPNAEEKIENINTRPIMVEIVKMIESSTNTLNCNFNNNNNSIIYNSTFFATASEQFIFNKIYHYLYAIYDQKYKSLNEEYLSIIKDINITMPKKDIMSNVGVNENYKGKEEYPYKSVIETINKISYEKYLKNKFEILAQSSVEMRSCILEYTNGKGELESMDDELPIIIYVVTQIKIDNIFAELYMIDDYIKCSMRDDLVQNKMVTNLLSGLLYISKTWDTNLKVFKS